LDSATCTSVTGWAQDPAVATTSIFTDVYYGGPAGGSGVTGIRLTADVDLSDLCSAIGSCNHGFSMLAPRSLMDDKAHAVYAYGINHTAGGANTLLTNSPKSITCKAPAIAKNSVKRHVVSPTILSDWKFDTFTDEAPYTTAEIAAIPDGENLASAPDVVQLSGNPAIYVVDGKAKRHVIDPGSMGAWRFASADVKPITAAALAALETGPDWPTTPLLAKDPTAPAVYMLDVPPDAIGVGEADAGVTGAGQPGSAAGEDGGAGGAGSAEQDAGWGAMGDAQGNGQGGGCSVARAAATGSPAWLLAVVAGLVFGRRARAGRVIGAGRDS
ncbi:MAG: hypothetical protein ACRELB_16815, partial [Polyangiaceae bacterium]